MLLRLIAFKHKHRATPCETNAANQALKGRKLMPFQGLMNAFLIVRRCPTLLIAPFQGLPKLNNIGIDFNYDMINSFGKMSFLIGHQ